MVEKTAAEINWLTNWTQFSTLLHSHFIKRVHDLFAFFKNVEHLQKINWAWTPPAFFQYTVLFFYYVLLFFPAASTGGEAGKKEKTTKVSMIKKEKF